LIPTSPSVWTLEATLQYKFKLTLWRRKMAHAPALKVN